VVNRPQKITLAKCARWAFAASWSFARTTNAPICRRSVAIGGRTMFGCPILSPLFVCQACGARGADLRPDFATDQRPTPPRPVSVR